MILKSYGRWKAYGYKCHCDLQDTLKTFDLKDISECKKVNTYINLESLNFKKALSQDQDRRIVMPDLGSNLLQRLSMTKSTLG